MSYKSEREISQIRKDRKAWLFEHGVAESDVMEDYEGEYIYSFEENGNPVETGYMVNQVQIYLPKELRLPEL